MDTLGIAELAERTGFSRPTLRYYEEIGLLDAPQRTETGYRVYDRGVEARLQFIRRAKRLGLSLEEIRSLVAVWAGGECAVTRRQLRQLVQVNIAAVREQVEDLATFLRQLEGVHDRLDELLTTGQSATGCECALGAVHNGLFLGGGGPERGVDGRLRPPHPRAPGPRTAGHDAHGVPARPGANHVAVAERTPPFGCGLGWPPSRPLPHPSRPLPHPSRPTSRSYAGNGRLLPSDSASTDTRQSPRRRPRIGVSTRQDGHP